MMSGGTHRRVKADHEVLTRLNQVVREIGTNLEAAEKTGVPYATLQRMLAGKSSLDHDRLAKIAQAGGTSVDYIMCRTDYRNAIAPPRMVHIPALPVMASAGDGSIAVENERKVSPFTCAEDWLRNNFGSVNDLRLVQVTGDSQEPNLSKNDWVIIDTRKNKFTKGLAVLVVDDCVMIKWVKKSGHSLHLLSLNPVYEPMHFDLRSDEGRIRVLGHAVYCFKALR